MAVPGARRLPAASGSLAASFLREREQWCGPLCAARARARTERCGPDRCALSYRKRE